MNYNEELDCWVVFWGGNLGYRVRSGEWFDLHLGYGRTFSCRLKIGRDWYMLTGLK
ncbi:DUF5348 domain-containing protein [Bacillus alkalicellulosilyticus]|uniref:DUF5348 domain-containing protein n=1 Tax=Alkalihalobacterium alkalicellulosilyticum TaxID=1912214 RepID=UPI001FE6ADB5|nr:DUF5348 domain-containing protein [Bacillus alkalicellulosilyticus]